MPDSEPSLQELLTETEETSPNRVLSAVGYIPFLCFLPLFARREDDFARFHGRQSLILLAALVGVWVLIWIVDLALGRVLGYIFIIGVVFKIMAWIIHYILGGVVSLSYLVAIILGAVAALGGKRWRIPVVGSLADQIPL